MQSHIHVTLCTHYMPIMLFLIESGFVFISLQVESIDDPVPAVEAILKRCNKQQVKKLL